MARNRDPFTFTDKDMRNYRTQFLGNAIGKMGGLLAALGQGGLQPGQRAQLFAQLGGTRLQPDRMKLMQMYNAMYGAGINKEKYRALKSATDWSNRPISELTQRGQPGATPSGAAVGGANVAGAGQGVPPVYQDMSPDQISVLETIRNVDKDRTKWQSKLYEFRKENETRGAKASDTDEARRQVDTLLDQILGKNSKLQGQELKDKVYEEFKKRVTSQDEYGEMHTEYNKKWSGIFSRAMRSKNKGDKKAQYYNNLLLGFSEFAAEPIPGPQGQAAPTPGAPKVRGKPFGGLEIEKGPPIDVRGNLEGAYDAAKGWFQGPGRELAHKYIYDPATAGQPSTQAPAAAPTSALPYANEATAMQAHRLGVGVPQVTVPPGTMPTPASAKPTPAFTEGHAVPPLSAVPREALEAQPQPVARPPVASPQVTAIVARVPPPDLVKLFRLAGPGADPATAAQVKTFFEQQFGLPPGTADQILSQGQ